MQLLHETTGQPKDRCLAALLNVQANVSSHEARLETAAAELMDQVDAQVAWRVLVVWCWLLWWSFVFFADLEIGGICNCFEDRHEIILFFCRGLP